MTAVYEIWVLRFLHTDAKHVAAHRGAAAIQQIFFLGVENLA